MVFYGIVDLFISFYLWCTILGNVCSGYNIYNKQKGIVFFSWAFPRKDHVHFPLF